MKQNVKGHFLLASFLFCTLLFQTFQFVGQGKNWNISFGSNITRYDYINKKGIAVDYLKPSSGLSFAMGFDKVIIDSMAIMGQSTKSAQFFWNHKKLAKILTKMEWSTKVTLNQYNAVGDIQYMAFDYQTNYLGIQGGVGVFQVLGKDWTLRLKGYISPQYLVQGNQRLNESTGVSYYDLRSDNSFNNFQVFAGYGLSIEKQIKDQLSFYIEAGNQRTFKAHKDGEVNLNFNATNLNFGIKIFTY